MPCLTSFKMLKKFNYVCNYVCKKKVWYLAQEIKKIIKLLLKAKIKT